MTDYDGVRNAVDDSVRARFERAKRDERAFVATASEAGVANDGTINLHLSNPSDSGVSVEVVQAIPTAGFSGWFRTFDDFSTAPSGGSTDGIDNLLMDTAGTQDTGNMDVKTGVSFTASNTHHIEVLPGGGTPGSQSGGQGIGTPPIIEPDREVVWEIENTSGAAGNAAFAIVYIELNEVFSV